MYLGLVKWLDHLLMNTLQVRLRDRRWPNGCVIHMAVIADCNGGPVTIQIGGWTINRHDLEAGEWLDDNVVIAKGFTLEFIVGELVA